MIPGLLPYRHHGGEGMPQGQRCDRKVGRAARLRATFFRAGLAVALAVVVAGLHGKAARAGDDDPDESFFSKFMRGIGIKRSGVDTSGIDYGERAPLVVPPSRDLPPPGSAPAPVADWPQNPVVKPHKHARGKAAPATPVPNAAASIADPNVSAAQASPEPEQKSSFSLNWFNKEEYAKFGSEPPRGDLTDPPTGYRTPSPEQPYGIGPDKKQAKVKKAGDGTEVEVPNRPK
jgi:hypothetical protein